MPAPPLIRSVRLAIGIGMVAGAIFVGCTVGGCVGWQWAIIGALAGIPLGAIVGLDLVVAGPGKRVGSKGPGAGPFQSTVLFALGAGAGFLACLFSIGKVTCDCTHRETGELDCRRTMTAWLGKVVYAQREFPDIQRVVQVRESMTQIDTADPLNSSTLDGFGPTTADRINAFHASTDAGLHLESQELWYFPWIFLAIGVVLTWLTIRSARWAWRELQKQLSDPDRRSATGW